MKTSNSRNHKSQPVPELIKQLWNLYFEMSLDPQLEASAAHIRSAALTLEHTRRVAFEITQETPYDDIGDADMDDSRPAKENKQKLPVRSQKFGSVMKH